MIPSTELEPRRLSVAPMPLENRWETIRRTATRADALGYESILLPETWAYDVMALLGSLALETDRIRLGSGIANVWSRSPAALAMSAATLQTLSGGRFVLGLGASTRQLVEGLHDVPFASPASRLEAALQQIRALLDGGRTPLAVCDDASPLRLNVPEHPSIPIGLAASSDRSLLIAGQYCESWLPFLVPRDRIADGKVRLVEGRRSAADPDRPIEVWPCIPTVVDADPAAARARAAWFVAFYLVSMGDLYRRALSRMGFEKEVEAVMEANRGKRPSEVPAEAQGLLDQLTVYGAPDEARAQLGAWYAAGADAPCLLLCPGLDEEEIDFTLEGLAP